jgi:tRNA 2-thiouridine synthesizing protein A
MSNRLQPDRKLDCLGLYCPEPVFRTRMELDKMKVGEMLEVIADDPAADPDINSLVKTLGCEVLDFRKENEKIIFLIKKK